MTELLICHFLCEELSTYCLIDLATDLVYISIVSTTTSAHHLPIYLSSLPVESIEATKCSVKIVHLVTCNGGRPLFAGHGCLFTANDHQVVVATVVVLHLSIVSYLSQSHFFLAETIKRTEMIPQMMATGSPRTLPLCELLFSVRFIAANGLSLPNCRNCLPSLYCCWLQLR